MGKYVKLFEQYVAEASVPGRAWSGKLKNLDDLFTWFYDKGILNIGEKREKDKIFGQYYRWYNDGDFPAMLRGLVRSGDEEAIERSLETKVEDFMKKILNKYTGKYDRKEFQLDTLLSDLYTLQGVVSGEAGTNGEPDPHGLLNYWGKKINVKDSEFEKMLGELGPLYDDIRKAADKELEKQSKDGVYAGKKSYEIPGQQMISYVRQRMQEDKVWNDGLEKMYQKMKSHMLEMGEILKNVIEGAEKARKTLGV